MSGALRLVLTDGTEGELSGFDGKLLSARLPRALAPGQPADFTLCLDPELSLSGRSIGSKRRDDGGFDVRFRLVNLTRQQRERLQEAV